MSTIEFDAKLPAIAGGISQSDASSQDNHAAATKAMQLLNSNMALLGASLGASAYPLAFVGITAVSTQVVAGMNYFLTLEVKGTDGTTHQASE